MQISPIKAFFVLLVALAAIAAVVLMTRPASPTIASNAPPESPDYSLTNAEAITRFKHLDAIRIQALRKRDTALVEDAFTPESPAADRLAKSIEKLRRTGVRDRSRETTKHLSVLRNDFDRIEIEQKVVIHSRFVTRGGRDVTTGRRAESQTIHWILTLHDSDWLISDATIVSAEPAQ